MDLVETFLNVTAGKLSLAEIDQVEAAMELLRDDPAALATEIANWNSFVEGRE